jgi:uncharacterized membrane protein YjgN (DUF898 family)
MDGERMLCPNCGNVNADGAAQCASCATVLAAKAPPALQVSAAPAQEHKLDFHGDGLTLLGIFLVNVLLTLATFGVFYFWAKVRVRRYLYSQTSFAGDRFAYHGTGLQLLVGWLKALCILAPILAAMVFLRLKVERPAGELLSTLLFYSALAVLVPIVIIGTWRFRLSRTSWRGIRFSFRGRAKPFMGEWFGGLLLTAVTLGIYGPGLRLRLQRYIANHIYFGKERFECTAEASEVIGRSLLCGILFFPTLGLSLVWLKAWRERYFWEHTIFKVDNATFKGARFQSSMSFGDLLALYFTNALLLIFTLGIAYPWVLVRTRKLHFSRLKIFGQLDLDALEQSAQAASALGEELGDVLDLGLFDFELGL